MSLAIMSIYIMELQIEIIAKLYFLVAAENSSLTKAPTPKINILVEWSRNIMLKLELTHYGLP